MKRYWVAVVLGAILGLGLAAFPNVPAASLEKNYLPVTLTQPQQQLGSSAGNGLLDLTATLIGLVLGVLVAVPSFIILNRRE